MMCPAPVHVGTMQTYNLRLLGLALILFAVLCITGLLFLTQHMWVARGIRVVDAFAPP